MAASSRKPTPYLCFFSLLGFQPGRSVDKRDNSRRYLYWGGRVDCPGKHCASCAGLGHQESSLRCALEEVLFPDRIFVMPARMCLSSVHNTKGILDSSNATSDQRFMECKDRTKCSSVMLPYTFLPTMPARKLRDAANKGGLPMYVATHGLYNLKPPTVFVPPCIRDDVEELLQIHRRMSQIELEVELVALDLGETYEICNDLVARPFQTHHTVPSQGYIIYSVRRKLKKQYAHLKRNQIVKLKQSGSEITDTILYPEVAFTGDTKSDFILDPRNADVLRAKILITEVPQHFCYPCIYEQAHTSIGQ